MAKNTLTKIMAFLALFGIIIGIIGTGLIIIFTSGNSNQETITTEQFLDMQNIINSQSGENFDITLTGSEIGTGEIK